MGPISRWAVFNPKKAVAIWLLLMIGIFGIAGIAGANYNDTFKLPDTESTKALNIVEHDFSAASNDATTGKIVVSPTTGTVDDPAVKKEVNALLDEVAKNPSVVSVVSPYEAEAAAKKSAASASGSSATTTDPAGTAGKFLAPVSPNREVAYATVNFKVDADNNVNAADVTTLLNTLTDANTATLQVGAAGNAIDFAGGEPPKTELVGIIVAFIILLLMFGAVVAAGVPILSAVIGLATGLGLVTIFTQFFDIATFAPTLATLIGLGVGIDYSLFVINRFKSSVDSGREVRAAAVESVNTSGRAVLFAATTVIIALGGLFVLGINFLNGLAIASMLTVFTVMLGALFLLPALLSWFGLKTFAIKLPWRREVKHHPNGTAMARYGAWLQRKPWVGLLALVVVVIIALPVLSLNQGFPDNGGKKPGTPARIGYDLLSEGFGPGINGPFIVAAELPKAGDFTTANALAKAIQEAPGVAGASNPTPNNFKDPSKSTAVLISVYPDSAPQSNATTDLLDALRSDVIPKATDGTGLKAYVGGSKATTSDFGKVLSDALPLFLLIVVGLGFIALTILFRSLVVPLTAALTSLLSFAAALGATVAVFQWGWLDNVFGVDATGPIFPFLPVMLFAILFGLSMDYQVFLVSRMQEEWAHTGDNRRSVRRGLAGSGRVVAAAGAIMFSVFISFVFGDDDTIKLFGLALATAVLIDAFLVRLVFVPALMTVLGNANWWLPGWLDRILPHFQVEQSEDEFLAEDALIEDVPDDDDDLQPSTAS